MKVNMNLVYILILGVGVLFAAATGILERLMPYEGFVNIPGTPGVRCGVDLPSCANGTQCMNGFCVNYNRPALTRNQLPVLP